MAGKQMENFQLAVFAKKQSGQDYYCPKSHESHESAGSLIFQTYR